MWAAATSFTIWSAPASSTRCWQRDAGGAAATDVVGRPAGGICRCARVIGRGGEGAEFVLTPEVTNCVSLSRTRQLEVLHLAEEEDPTLADLRAAAELGVWLLDRVARGQDP
jgi:hypothetical protein